MGLLPLRRVLGHLPAGRLSRASSWQRPAATRSPATMRPGSPASCTCGPPSARPSRSRWPRSSPCSCTRRAGPMSSESLALFEFIPAELIHDLGIVVMVLVALGGLAGHRPHDPPDRASGGVDLRVVFGDRAAVARSARAAWSSIGRESLAQTRFREDCERAPVGPGTGAAGSSMRWSCGASSVSSRRPSSTTGSRSSGQGDRDTGADLVSGPPPRDRRRDHARLRDHRDDRGPGTPLEAGRWPARAPPTGPSSRCSGSRA